jgi:hypothetical protein
MRLLLTLAKLLVEHTTAQQVSGVGSRGPETVGVWRSLPGVPSDIEWLAAEDNPLNGVE